VALSYCKLRRERNLKRADSFILMIGSCIDRERLWRGERSYERMPLRSAYCYLEKRDEILKTLRARCESIGGREGRR
jgi:hypothetical protein